MIMWRKRITLASVALLLAIVPSCGPDLGDIHLSDCMKDCNSVAKTCLDASDKKLEACAPDDKVCQLQTVHESEACLTSCLDCIDVCVAETEKTLKK